MDPNQPGKSSATKKWLIGCGIGCGVIVVLAALLITGGVLYVRSLVEGFKDSEAMLEILTERYGRITEYCPEPDGRIPAGHRGLPGGPGGHSSSEGRDRTLDLPFGG